jgi:hypothetical protein
MDRSSFQKDYAKALAEALREAEDSPPTRDPSVLLDETYRQLCHDCPINLSSHGCFQLGRILLRDDKKQEINNDTFVLTDRFVSGLLQALDKIERSNTVVPQAESTLDDEAATEPHESFVVQQQHTDQDTDSALAALAWTVFGRIPLEVLTANNLEDAAKLIGSFRGSPVDLLEHDSNDDESSDEPSEQPSDYSENDATIPLPDVTKNGHVLPPDQSDELEEVWADDSDGSDFEFESDRFQAQEHLHNNLEANTVQYADSWLQIAQAMTNLLSYLSFTKLSSLSMNQWKKLGISDHLMRLSLMLLLQQPFTCLLQVYPSHHWQRLALQPIHYFRDATLQHRKDLLDDYLQFLSTLLQVQTATLSKSSTSLTTLMPCTILGVSLLSALCSTLLGDSKQQQKTNAIHLKLVRQTILECSDDLTMILELAMSDSSNSSSNSTGETDKSSSSVLPWAFLSLWQVVVAACGSLGLENAQAQILLNSGLFRQWLQWWERLYLSETNGGDNGACRVVQESLFEACLVSPKLLGKYAWRFPGFASRVCRIQDNNDVVVELDSAVRLMDATLWNLLAAELADTSVTPAVVWKKKLNDSTSQTILQPPVLSACQDAAWIGFQLVCDLVVESTSDWKRRRLESLPASMKLESQRDAVTCFVSLIDRLIASPQLLSEDFLKRLTARASSDSQGTLPSSNGSMNRASCLDPIQDVLYKWSSTPTPLTATKLKSLDLEDALSNGESGNVASSHTPQAGDMDEQETADPNARKARLNDQTMDDAIQQLRRSLKSFQSVLDSAFVNKKYGVKLTASAISSKAD